MLTIRRYDPTDAIELLARFRQTIRLIDSVDYDPTQIRAWASDEIDIDGWRERFKGRYAYVAMIDGRHVGFADMATAGYLDRLFVSAEHQRQGIANALLAKLKTDARRAGITPLMTNASITAKPFVEASGFTVIRKQIVECRGVELTNYHMVLTIGEIG